MLWQANLLNDYLLPHEKGEKKRATKRKIKPLQKNDGEHVQVCNSAPRNQCRQVLLICRRLMPVPVPSTCSMSDLAAA